MSFFAQHNWWIYAIIILIASGITYWTYHRKGNQLLTSQQRIGLAILRFCTLTLLGLLLFSPLIIYTSSHEQKPQLVIALDQSKSMNNVSINSAELIKQLRAVSDKLSEKYEIDTIGFGDHLTYTWSDTFSEAQTDFFKLSEYLNQKYFESNLQEVLIITDGKNNAGNLAFGPEYMVNKPISFLAYGDTTPIVDYSLDRVVAPQSVIKGNEVIINVEYSCKNIINRKAQISLFLDGHSVNSKTIEFSSSTDFGTLQFSYIFPTIGRHSLCAEISGSESDVNPANNRRCVTIEVVSNQMTVDLHYSAVHPDIAAIERALEPQKNIKLRKIRGFQNLQASDITILHNPDGSDGIRTLLQSNRPTWIINGIHARSEQMSGDGTGITSTRSSSTELLPVFNSSFSYFNKEFIRPDILAQMPPLVIGSSYISSTLPSISLLETTSGKGLMTYVKNKTNRIIQNGEGIWRWRMYENKITKSSEMVDNLITQNIYFLRPTSQKSRFDFRMSKSEYALNEPLIMYAEYLNDNSELDNAGTVEVTVKGEGYNETKIMNQMSFSYQLQWDPLPTGTYTFDARWEGNGQVKTEVGQFTVLTFDIEGKDNHADINYMRSISSRWKGQIYLPQELQKWKQEMLNRQTQNSLITTNRHSEFVEIYWILGLLVLLLTTEWLLRKWWGIL